MKTLKSGKINLMVNADRTTIELICEESRLTFARVELTPEQLSQALSRLAYTPCSIELVERMDLVGKKMENKYFEFEINESMARGSAKDVALYEQALKLCPEGWVPDNYFNSQNSFFSKDGKQYARVTIRRWI